MKKKMMSAVMAAAVAAVTAALLGGCGGKETSGSPEASGTKEEETTAQGSKETKEEKTGGAGENTEAGNADGGEYTVAVVKQMDHASLDEIAAAVCEELDALAEKNGVSIQYEVYSGQGDQSVLTQIGTQVAQRPVGRRKRKQRPRAQRRQKRRRPAGPEKIQRLETQTAGNIPWPL